MGLTQVSTDGVKNDAITKTKIPANQIEASELADNAVDTNAIANNAVTAGKLASGVQTTINNNADNRVITGSGTANTLEGEATFTHNPSTFDTTISHSGNTPADLIIENTHNSFTGAVARLIDLIAQSLVRSFLYLTETISSLPPCDFLNLFFIIFSFVFYFVLSLVLTSYTHQVLKSSKLFFTLLYKI